MSKLFIPEKCRVGFQLRGGTFTGLLAYVIYYDAKGKIRKEVSWDGWRQSSETVTDRELRYGFGINHDEALPATEKVDAMRATLVPKEFENVPTRGFVLNKGVQRCNWSHFGSNRSMIRIYDPRGWELEITPDNLVKILMHVDCNRREIGDELVYAWGGTELVLLPCSSTVYAEAKRFTGLQSQRVMARDLEKGWTYTTNREDVLCYLGRHPWHEMKSNVDGKSYREKRMVHVFCDMDGEVQAVPSVPSRISSIESSHCHDDYAKWVDEYLALPQSSALAGWRREPIDQSSDYDGVACYFDSEPWADHDALPEGSGFFTKGELYSGEAVGRYTRGWEYRSRRQYDSGQVVAAALFRKTSRIGRDGTYESLNRQYGQRDVRDSVNPDLSQAFQLVAIYENGHEEPWRYW